MFIAMKALLAKVDSINMTITGTNDQYTVIVVPKAKIAGEGLQQPLVLKGTAEELDAEFVGLIGRFTGGYVSLAEQCEATLAIQEAAKKESATKAKSAMQSKSKVAPAKNGADEDDEDLDDILKNTAGTFSKESTPATATSTDAVVPAGTASTNSLADLFS